MTDVYWLTATPRVAATGAAATVRLAGGGEWMPFRKGGQQFRAGIVSRPRFRAALGFGAAGWTGGTVPTTGAVRFMPGEPDLIDDLAGYLWKDAPITFEVGAEGAAPSTLLTGRVADMSIDSGALILTIADLSTALDKPAITARFAGTGGVEGIAEAEGRIKRRSWGRVFNIEGRVLDKANNIYEFGDPAFKWQGWEALRDKGRDGAFTVVGWQGSIAATLAALAASVPVSGGGVVAPSIACAKWWTQPAGPLTADILGEIGAGYVETVPSIAAALLSAVGGPAITNVAAVSAARPDPAGLHIGDGTETVAQALDRIFLGVSLAWVLQPAGSIVLREWSFDAPVETIRAHTVQRRRQYAPIKSRRLGYQRAERRHSDGEIAAALTDLERTATLNIYQRSATVPALPSAEVTYTYADGTIAGLNNGWLTAIPAGTDPIYTSTAFAIATTPTAAIGTEKWTPARVLAQNGAPGTNGANGLNSAVVILIKRTDGTAAPAVPAAALTYTFATGALSGGSLDGWTATDPGIGSGTNRWEIRARPSATAATATINSADWSAPAVTQAETLSNSGLTITQTGVPAAADGTVSPAAIAALGTQFIVKRDQTIITADASVVFSVVSSDGGTIQFNTATNDPIAGKPKGFARPATLTADIATFVLRATIGGTKIVEDTYRVIKNRAAVNGISSQSIWLYKRTTSNVAPAVPDNDITYTFADNSLAGSLDGWSQSEPPVTAGPWLWATHYFASGEGASVVIPPAGWLTPPNLERLDDFGAYTSTTGWTIPAATDGTVSGSYLPLETQLYFRTSSAILLGPTQDTAGVTVSLVSAPAGSTVTINTATNTPVAGKPKGFIRISVLASGTDPNAFIFKATKDGVDYPTLPLTVTKAIKGATGDPALGIRIAQSLTKITRDQYGKIWPAVQTTALAIERQNFTGGAVAWSIANLAGVAQSTALLSATSGDTISISAANVEAGAGTTGGVRITAVCNGQTWSVVIHIDPVEANSSNLFPDPLLNTRDTLWAGGSIALPFGFFINGDILNYPYKNYLRCTYTTQAETSHAVATGVPCRPASKLFVNLYGCSDTGGTPLALGMYFKFFKANGTQTGATQTVTSNAASALTAAWPKIAPPLGYLVTPADAVTMEFGWIKLASTVLNNRLFYLSNPYIGWSDVGANSTEEAQARMVWPQEEQVVDVSYEAAIKSYPTTLRAYRFRGETDVTGDTAWSIANPTNMTVSIGAATGIVTVSAISGQGHFDIVSVHNNYSITKRIFYVYDFDTVPVGIGNVSSDSANTSAAVSVSNASYGSTPIIGPYFVRTGASGSLKFFGYGIVRAASGQGKLEMKPQYRIKDSGGAWTDTSPVLLQAAYAVYNADTPAFQSIGGAGAVIFASANTDYEVRWVARMDANPGAPSSAVILVNGTFWVRGQ